MAGKSQREKVSVFTMLEEATYLLRRMPATAWLWYFTGTAPFVLFLFFFWSDMARSSQAENRLLESSLLLALLFIWMKVGQALFCERLMLVLEGKTEDLPKMPARGWGRLLASQAWIHGLMPLVLMLSLLAILPFAWMYAFFHNVTVLAPGHYRRGGRTRPLLNDALTQSHFQPRQNHYTILIMVILTLLVYLNILAGFVMVTILAKSFTGSDNVFSMNPWLYFNTSLQSLFLGLTYLVVNPLNKAIYSLRCFYGLSRKTGADLMARLYSIQRKGVAVGTLGILLLCSAAMGQEQGKPGQPGESEQLSVAIQDVLRGSEYQWRLPREGGADPDNEQSWLGAAISELGDWISSTAESIGKFIGELADKMFNRGKGRGGAGGDGSGAYGEGSTWVQVLPNLLIVVLIALALGVIWMLWKQWKKSRLTLVEDAPAAPGEVNLESEQTIASQLPENEWLRLAREKMAAGDLRLALRALFLATLANLGEKRLLTITRSKSNGDYVKELTWRARGADGLKNGFSDQVRTFDRVWYGWHEVNADLMQSFEQQHERITSHAS